MTKHQKYFNDRKCEIVELPYKIFIESTMSCNLRCGMCPVPDPLNNMNGRKYSNMSFETYRTIIDQISQHGRMVRLNQLGEPLLNSEIVDFVSYARWRGHHVGLTTNASILNTVLAEKLILAGLSEIVFSFDGCKKETYEKIRVGANYDKVLANILEFSRLNRLLKGRCIVRVDCIVSDLTFLELEQIKKFWWEKKIPVNFIPLDDWSGKIQLPTEYGIRRSVANKKNHRYPCHLLWTSMAISSEGKAIYCCHDYKQQSNLPLLTEKSLQEIWNSEIKDIRAKHVMGIIDDEPCRSCDAWMTMPEFYQAPRVTLNGIKIKIKSLVRERLGKQ
jgi:radical SAM protein with 4Fe4S-binding SPASM domain